AWSVSVRATWAPCCTAATRGPSADGPRAPSRSIPSREELGDGVAGRRAKHEPEDQPDGAPPPTVPAPGPDGGADHQPHRGRQHRPARGVGHGVIASGGWNL